jgi:hypothetical protein
MYDCIVLYSPPKERQNQTPRKMEVEKKRGLKDVRICQGEECPTYNKNGVG